MLLELHNKPNVCLSMKSRKFVNEKKLPRLVSEESVPRFREFIHRWKMMVGEPLQHSAKRTNLQESVNDMLCIVC